MRKMFNTAAKGIKNVIKSFPPVTRLLRDRDNLSLDLARMAGANEMLTSENDFIKKALLEMSRERDGLLVSRDVLVKERDELLGHLDRISGDVSRLGLQVFNVDADANLLEKERVETLARYGQIPFVPNGHFYSPITSRDELLANADAIFCAPPASLPGIDLRVADQLSLIGEFGAT